MNAIAALLALLAGAGAAVALVLWMGRFAVRGVYGSASFGPWPDRAARRRADLPPGLVLGKDAQGRYASWTKEGHWLLVAPTGAGKSTGVIEPSLLKWRGSFLAVDVKGDLVRRVGPRLRDEGVRTLRYDPFGVCDGSPEVEAVAIDAFAPVAGARDAADACLRLANILIDPPAGGDAHWAESARSILAGLLAASHAASSPVPRQGDLLAGCEASIRPGRPLDALLGLLEGGPAAIARLRGLRLLDPDLERLVARACALVKGAGPSERGAMLSTIRRQLAFFSSRALVSSMSGRWRPAELLDEERPQGLFLVLPASRLGSHGRLLRLAVGLLVDALLTAGTSPRRRLLLALDEASALGPLEAVAQGVGLFRGFGATFLLCFQDDGQLEAAYGDRLAGSIRANCHAAYWAVRDLETSRRLAAALGTVTVGARSRQSGRLPLDAGGASGVAEAARPLLLPEEIRTLPPAKMLALAGGRRPCMLERIGHDEWIAAPNETAPAPAAAGRPGFAQGS